MHFIRVCRAPVRSVTDRPAVPAAQKAAPSAGTSGVARALTDQPEERTRPLRDPGTYFLTVPRLLCDSRVVVCLPEGPTK